MPPLPRRLALTATFILIAVSTCVAQEATSDGPPKTASISGVVMADGRPAAGVPVWVSEGGTRWKRLASAETDAEGRYRFENLPPGRFVVSAFKAGYFFPVTRTRWGLERHGRLVALGEGEVAESIDVALTRGGVITGRVTDQQGRPLAEVSVDVETFDEDGNRKRVLLGLAEFLRTDDRGVYRIYGLPPGRYVISASELGERASLFPKTYYPGTLPPQGIKTIEIIGTEEVGSADIVVPVDQPARLFTVSGRVVDAETGAPVEGAKVVLESGRGGASRSTETRPRHESTNASGEFRIANVPRGDHFALVNRPCGPRCGYFAGGTWITVAGDTRDVTLRARRGATVEGYVVLEGNVEPSIAEKVRELEVTARRIDFTAWQHSNREEPRAQVGSDGRFRLQGLQPGTNHIELEAPKAMRGFHLLRVEGDEDEYSSWIEITEGRNLSGIRLVVAYGVGVIKGRVRFVNGTIDPLAHVLVEVSSRSSFELVDLNDGNEFLMSGLLPGRYEITVHVKDGRSSKQWVTVPDDGAPVDVSFTFDLGATEPGAPGQGVEDQDR